jgi:hypothetical protein
MPPSYSFTGDGLHLLNLANIGFYGYMLYKYSMVPTEEKGFEYALWPLVTTLPSGMMAWFESISCTSSAPMKLYGHVLYDFFMVSSYIAFYPVCYAKANFSGKLKSL